MSDSVRPHRQQPTRLPRPWDSPGKNTGVGCHFLLQCMKVKSESEVAQLCLTIRDPMDCSLPGSSVHGIFQARVLEWGAISFSYRHWRILSLYKLSSTHLCLRPVSCMHRHFYILCRTMERPSSDPGSATCWLYNLGQATNSAEALRLYG